MSDPRVPKSISLTREDLSAAIPAWRKTGNVSRRALRPLCRNANAIARAAGTVPLDPGVIWIAEKNLRLGRRIATFSAESSGQGKTPVRSFRSASGRKRKGNTGGKHDSRASP